MSAAHVAAILAAGWRPCDRKSMHRVLPYLYQGDYLAANDQPLLEALGITYTVSLEPRLNFAGNKHILRFHVEDDPSQDLRPYFDRAYHFIEQARTRREGVLVHCAAGVSRASTFVLYYLMRRFGVSLAAALQHLIDARPCARPNAGFLQQLLEQEAHLRQ